MAPVDFVNVRKSFGAVPIIKGVNIEIADGEFVILVGPFRLRQVDACCACWPDLRTSPPAKSASAGGWSTGCRRKSATSPWCSRTTRSIRT